MEQISPLGESSQDRQNFVFLFLLKQWCFGVSNNENSNFSFTVWTRKFFKTF